MPYSITQDAADCDGYAVVKDEDGEVMGCHDTQDEAADQVAALEASEGEEGEGMDGDDGRMHRSYTADASIRMASDDARTTVQVMTEDIARDGMILRADGFQTDDYMANPVVLWDHGMDPQRGSRPIARAVDMQRVDGGIRATVEWYDDEFSRDIQRQVKRGFLSAVSVGWRTLEMEHEEVEGRSVPVVREADMTEFSFVGVPADAGALVVQRSGDDLDARIQAAVRQVLVQERSTLAHDIAAEITEAAASARDGATAPTPRTDSPPDATADGGADVQRDDGPDQQYLTVDEVEREVSTIIKRLMGKA